ncbi:hypothetical protein IP78_02480 [Brevundimonas sp. AAP58]|uniref:DUF423 domain-containing protein n=1 Tax=Brevundimonas sp. AAP58 TaxID=1523422 RepID=UPI0006B8A077|nr:DUF423 domain-containing protein [Brevundimonas sp. AAP58]KPF83295.1 hypothetical protein IP78_02480 [Brevundimonas sp. AAP58]
MSWNRSLAGFAALNGTMAVAVGAFAAHGAGPQVKTFLTTGASYQLTHALLGLVCALWPAAPRLAHLGGWLAAAGGLIFCVALSLIGLASLPALGAVAPVGGVLMIAGWVVVALAAFRPPSINA